MNFLQDRRVVLALGTLAIASLVWNVVLPLVQERGSGSSVADVVVDAGVTEMPQQSVPGNPLASTAGTGSPHAERFGVLDTTAPAGRDPFTLPARSPLAQHVRQTAASVTTSPAAGNTTQLTAVIVTSSLRAAVIDGVVTQRGNNINGNAIERIDPTGVALRSPKGTGKLYQYEEWELMKRRMIPLAGGILLAGCTVHAPIDTSVDRSVAAPAPEVATDAVANAVPVPLTLEQRLAYPSPDITAPRTAGEHLYSFVAQNLPISQALQIFREAYQLNIVTDSDVAGTLTVDFRDLPFDQAMEAMLDSLGLYWSREGNLIRVRSRQTRTFVIDYIRLVRSGSGSSLAQIASNSSSSSGSTAGSGSGTSASGESGKITIEQSDTVQFWSELEEQIGTLTSESGRLVINRMAGTIQVTDAYPRVQEIGRFVNEINRAVHRQVDIDVRIVEVSLNDDFSLGIDWSRLTPNGNTGVEFNLQTGNIVTQPAGGFNAKLPTLATDIFSVNSSGVFDFTAMLDALREQGTVRVVSQPQIRALNNQSAMIKVGTDRTFFRREVTTNSTTSGSTIESEDVPQVVTEGIVLALTPQIATSGWIMLDVSPVVTRVSSIATALDENGNVRSTAPNLDIRQASSLVRVRNGETIVIGGLIQDQQSDTERTVPGIGNVPVLGRLFGGTYQVRGKKELVMFLTARLVESRDMAALN